MKRWIGVHTTAKRSGLYHLGRVTGEWQYRNSLAHRAADVVNIRECEWRPAEAVDGDLLALYLQLLMGFVLIPSSCKTHSQAYGFVLRQQLTGELAAAQVISSENDIRCSAYADFPGKVFLFSQSGGYVGDKPANVVYVQRQELESFLALYRTVLPARILSAMDLARKLLGHTAPLSETVLSRAARGGE
jgi:hypothetical protein